MASLQERIRVNRAHGVRNTMTDYGASSLYDIDECEEQRDRVKRKIAQLRFRFDQCCSCGHTDAAYTHAIDLAYWQSKLTTLRRHNHA